MYKFIILKFYIETGATFLYKLDSFIIKVMCL